MIRSKYALFFLVLAAVLFVLPQAEMVLGGAKKSGGGYEIADDALNVGGGIVEAASWRLINSIGQGLGFTTMIGGTYEMQGGFVSGIEAVFSVQKSVTQVEAPAGYNGAPTDPVPGARVTYQLSFINYGEAADTNTVLIEDVIPTNATYVAGTIKYKGAGKTDAVDGDECRYESGPKKAVCAPPNVAAGETGIMEFKITIE